MREKTRSSVSESKYRTKSTSLLIILGIVFCAAGLLTIIPFGCGPAGGGGDSDGDGEATAEEQVEAVIKDYLSAVWSFDRDGRDRLSVSRVQENRAMVAATVANIKTLGMAVQDYIQDNPDIGSPKTDDIEELSRILLEGKYLANSITKDGWDNPLLYECETREGSPHYRIISYGEDNQKDMDFREPLYAVALPERDVIWIGSYQSPGFGTSADLLIPGVIRQEMMQAIKEEAKTATVEVKDISTDDDKAVAAVTLSYGFGKVRELKAELTSENGEWKMAALHPHPGPPEKDVTISVPQQKMIEKKEAEESQKKAAQKFKEEEQKKVEEGLIDFDTGDIPDAPFILVVGDIERPKFTSKGPKVYPEKAKAERISGLVRLEVKIDRTGKMVDIKILYEKPPGYGFGEAAVNYISNGKWTPAKENGKPINAIYLFTIDYRLN